VVWVNWYNWGQDLWCGSTGITEGRICGVGQLV
jgi:hypothetical protein